MSGSTFFAWRGRNELFLSIIKHTPSSLSLFLSSPWITADVHRVFCRLYFGFLSRPRVAACKKRLLMRVGAHTGFVADVYDLKVRRWQIASKLLFFHEVSVARGQGLSPLSSVGHLSTLLSVDHPSIRNEGKFSTREPEPIPVMLYDYAHRIILSNPRFYSLRGNTWIPRITRVKDGHAPHASRFTRLEVMTFRVRRVTFA